MDKKKLQEIIDLQEKLNQSLQEVMKENPGALDELEQMATEELEKKEEKEVVKKQTSNLKAEDSQSIPKQTSNLDADNSQNAPEPTVRKKVVRRVVKTQANLTLEQQRKRDNYLRELDAQGIDINKQTKSNEPRKVVRRVRVDKDGNRLEETNKPVTKVIKKTYVDKDGNPVGDPVIQKMNPKDRGQSRTISNGQTNSILSANSPTQSLPGTQTRRVVHSKPTPPPKEKNTTPTFNETKLGLKIFNYVGIILIFLAVIWFGIWSIDKLNDLTLSILIFVVPTLVLAAGLFFKRKNKDLFAYGLIGGSIGLYYIAVYINSFVIREFDFIVTSITFAIVSILAVFLAKRFKQEIFAILGLIGAYLPVINYGIYLGYTSTSLLIAQAYIVGISIVMILASKLMKWKYTQLITFACWSLSILSFLSLNNDVLYTYVTSIVYAGIYIIYPSLLYRKNSEEITVRDQGMSIVAMFVFLLTSLTYGTELTTIYRALVILVLTLVYGWNSYVYITKGKKSGLDLVITIISYVGFVLGVSTLLLYELPYNVLFRPEYSQVFAAFLIVMFVQLTNIEKSKWFGFTAIGYIALSTFGMMIDMGHLELDIIINTVTIFTLFYAFYMFKEKHLWSIFKIKEQDANRIFTITNWLTLPVFGHSLSLYIVSLLPNTSVDTILEKEILISILFGIVVYLFYRFMKKFSDIIVVVGQAIVVNTLFWTFLLNNQEMQIRVNNYIITEWLNILLSFIALLGTIYVYNETLKLAKTNTKFKSSLVLWCSLLYPFILSTIMVSFVQFVPLPLDNSIVGKLIVDVIFVIVSINTINKGFKQNLSNYRLTGLIMTLLITGKLLVLDIPTATTLSKVIVFAIFGVLFIATSYIYQNALNKLEVKETEETESVVVSEKDE